VNTPEPSDPPHSGLQRVETLPPMLYEYVQLLRAGSFGIGMTSVRSVPVPEEPSEPEHRGRRSYVYSCRARGG